MRPLHWLNGKRSIREIFGDFRRITADKCDKSSQILIAIRILFAGLVTSLEFFLFFEQIRRILDFLIFFTISSEIKAELRAIARLFSHISSELHSKPELSFKSLFLGEELSLISSTVQLQLATKLFAKFAFMCLRLQNTTEKKNIFCELLKASLLPHKPKPNDTTTIAMYPRPEARFVDFPFSHPTSKFFLLSSHSPTALCMRRAESRGGSQPSAPMSAAGEYLSTRWCKKKKRKWKAFSEQSTSCCTVVLVILVRTIFVGCTLGGRYAFLAAQFHVTLPSSAANSARSESGTRRSSRVFAMESTSTFT